MENTTLAIEEKVRAFSRELAQALRNLTGKNATSPADQEHQPDASASPTSASSEAHPQ